MTYTDKEEVLEKLSLLPLASSLFDNFRDDKEVVLVAIENNIIYPHTNVLSAASTRLQDDREVVLASVLIKGVALDSASVRLRDDREVVLVSVNQEGRALRYASERLQDDKEVVLAAVTNDEYVVSLGVASERLRDDKEVVLAAVNFNGGNLEYTSDRLRNDKELVLAAIKTNAYGLEFVSDELKNDKEIALIALKRDGILIKYLSNKLKDDADILYAAINVFKTTTIGKVNNLFGENEEQLQQRYIRFASDRLRKLCEGRDPAEALKAEIKRLESEKLGDELATKGSMVKEKKLKV